VLRQNKNDYLIYYKTDSHWNNLGAFYAYTEIMKSVGEDFPEIQPLKLNDYILEIDTVPGLVLAGMINKNDVYTDLELTLHPQFTPKAKYGVRKNYPIPEEFYYKDQYEMVRGIPGSKMPRAMIVRDSFTNYLIGHFAETFGNTLFIWDNWQYQLNKNIIENDKPDIFLILLVERHLNNLLENIEDFEDPYSSNSLEDKN